MNIFDIDVMSCTIYTASYNFATLATCLLTFIVYKYSELQMSFAIQKLSCKANCKNKPFSYSVLLPTYPSTSYFPPTIQNLYLPTHLATYIFRLQTIYFCTPLHTKQHATYLLNI
jgi:hypothetical protein